MQNASATETTVKRSRDQREASESVLVTSDVHLCLLTLGFAGMKQDTYPLFLLPVAVAAAGYAGVVVLR